ncbi:MAG: hypothetical protein SGI86_18485 [Deltaproteobacteria bacterium]|nr:hypothetical protein [Deltaproteobacteria bacterium]
MISQFELEKAIARYRARTSGAAVPIDASSYPAEVEVGYEGGVTPVPSQNPNALPREAYRSDSEIEALGHQHDMVTPAMGSRTRGNDEPTVVGDGASMSYVADMDSGVVELDDEDDR